MRIYKQFLVAFFFCILCNHSVAAQSYWRHVPLAPQSSGPDWHAFCKAADSLDFVYAEGSDMRVYRTQDGGVSWKAVLGDSPLVLFPPHDLTHPSPNLIIIAADSDVFENGNTYDTAGVICRSTDGGRTWNFTTVRSLNPSQRYSAIYAIAALDSNHIFLPTPGNANYLCSQNGGATWETIPAPAIDRSIYSENGAAYTAPNTLLVMQWDSAYAYTNLYTFYRSTNLGTTWTRGMTTTHDISKFCFISPLVGFAAGSIYDLTSVRATATIDKTIDGGLTWSNIYTHRFSSAGGLLDIAFADSLHGLAVGRNGIIIRTNNGGKTWLYDSSDFSEGYFDLLRGVACPTSTKAIIASGNGEALVYKPEGILSMPFITYPRYIEPNGVPPTFDATWNPVPGAKSYYVRLSFGDFADTILQDPNVTGTSFHFSNLEPNTYTLYVQARSDTNNSNMGKREFIVVSPSVVESDPLAQYLYVENYPNPASNVLHVRLSGIYSNPEAQLTAEMYDALGRKVMTLSDLARKGNNGKTSEFDVDISTLPAGIYMVQYTLGGYSYGRPVVVIH